MIGPGLLVCMAAWAPAVDGLENGSFEAGAGPDGLPAGWSSLDGATHDTDGPPSTVELDATRATDGTASLRLAGDATTSLWHYLYQDVAIAEGERVVVRATLRTEGVRREAGQYQNPPLLLDFLDADGGRLGRIWTSTPLADRDWGEALLEGIAPAGTTQVRVGLFLSMSGALWVDDVRLERHPAWPFDAAARRTAAEAVERRLRATYPFFELADKPQADDLFARFGERLRTPAEDATDGDLAGFTDVLAEMLGALEDTHVSLQTPEGWRWTHPSTYDANWNAQITSARLEGALGGREGWLVGRLEGNIGYVLIATLVLTDDAARALDLAMDSLGDCTALVLDLRPNGGGDENRARWIASRFATESVVYARHAFRDPFAVADTNAFLPPSERVLHPRKDREADGRPVVVLQGPACVSSTESLLLMLRALPQVTTVGLSSRGSSGNPQAFEVVPGLTLVSSTWRNLTPEGTCIEGVGVAPDIEVEAPAVVYRVKDPTLDRALELLGGD